MKLKDLSDAELGRIVREGPLWPILLKMETANEKNKERDIGALTPTPRHPAGATNVCIASET